MSRLSVLLFKTYTGPFVVTFFVAVFVFEMQFIWVYLDDLVGKDLGFWNIAKLLAYASVRLINMALPLAILMSSMMCMGSMSEYNELTAIKSAGVSLLRIMRPLTAFNVALALCAFLVANNLWPIANLKFRSMMYSIAQQRPALHLQDGVFYNGIEGISIRVKHNERKTGELTDVLIYDHRDPRKANKTVIRAERGVMKQTSDKRFLIFDLYNGHSYDEQVENRRGKPDLDFPLISSHFSEMSLRIDLSSFLFSNNKEELFKNQFDMMSVGQLYYAIDSLQQRLDSSRISVARGSLALVHMHDSTRTDADYAASTWFFDLLTPHEQVKALEKARENLRRKKEQLQSEWEVLLSQKKYLNRHKIEFHRKFFFAFACLVMFFIGAPLGAIIRKGGLGLPTIIALVFFIFYQLITMAGEKMAKSGILEPWMGVWLSSLIIFPLAVFLTVKASQDVLRLDSDTMWRAIRSFFTRKKNV